VTTPREARLGALSAIGAFGLWGLTPLYFKAMGAVPAGEIIAHRVLWSVPLLAAMLALGGGWRGLTSVWRTPRLLATLALSASLVTGNWLVYVWAVNAGRVLESSLGYFIVPLVSVALGALVLRERLSLAQRIAVGLALAGVANQVIQIGTLPWVSLTLASTFGIYGLLRKRLPLESVSALLVEVLLASPAALIYMAWLGQRDALSFGRLGITTDLLLVAAGVVTVVPLLLFTFAARRLTLSTLGFLQYLAPSLMFVLGVFLYGETLSASQMLTFGLIWLGLALYTAELWRRRGHAPSAPA
jgi:chloramphenicol-sensitive protein RarD